MIVRDDDSEPNQSYIELEGRYDDADFPLSREHAGELTAAWQQCVGGEEVSRRLVEGVIASLASYATDRVLELIKAWLTKTKASQPSVNYLILFRPEEYEPSKAAPPEYLHAGVTKRRERVVSTTKKENEHRVYERQSRCVDCGPYEHKVCTTTYWDEVTYSHERVVVELWVQGIRRIGTSSIGDPVWLCVGFLEAGPWGPEFETSRVTRQKEHCETVPSRSDAA